jgi:F-box/leucine-rich repeat protein 2/20
LPRPTAFFEEEHIVLPRFAHVRHIELQFCDDLLDTHLERLPPSVSELTLDGCHGLTDAGIKMAATGCAKRLERLTLYCNNNVTNAALLTLSLRCPSLTHLSLSGCKQIATTGVLSLASRCRRLRALNLTRLPLVDDTALGALVQSNPDLRELRLYACSQYTDTPLLAVAGCRQLTTLDCTGLSQLSDAVLLALGASCATLSTLLLTWVTGLTDIGVVAVSRGCPLAVLSLHGIKGVGEGSLSALAEHRASTLVALDIRGCVGIEGRSRESIVALLPLVRTFVLAL